jgi:peroxiredoxin
MKNLILTVAALVALSFTTQAQGYKPGDKASDFSLKNVIDGKTVSLKNYPDAKGIIVVFTCNHCPFAKMYESRIIDLNNKYASKGFPVVAISANDPKIEPSDSPENMAKLAKDKNYTFPYLYDESQEIAKAYGAQKTPHVFVLKKTGMDYTVEFIGAIDDNAQDASGAKNKYVEKAIEEIANGKPVTTKSVKAVGCGIKWKS